MNAGLPVDVTHGTDQLCKDLLDLLNGQLAMLQEVVVKLVTYGGDGKGG